MTGPVSQLLIRWSEGDGTALDELVPLVYDQLRALGRSYLARRPHQVLLEPTVLVHEAWLQLAFQQELRLNTRLQFFALAAKVMRDVLSDHFRRQHAAKRGGSRVALQWEGAEDPGAPPGTDWLVLDDALNRLSRIKPRYAQIVELKFFAGLTIEESAEALRTSHATIEREWNFARLWLRRELGDR